MENDSTEISDNNDSEATLPRPAEAVAKRPGSTKTVVGHSTLILREVGNFEILSELGRGAFGAVYKARDISLGRTVAIKFLHNPLDEKRQKLFFREARALAALSKEASIVEVYQWGEHQGQNYIVLEYVDSGTEKLLAENPNGLPVAQALGIVADCAEALQAAHDQGILHRDIKPANILVESKTGRAKVADFGLARLDDDSGFTLAGGVSGSPPYMSPEQASAAEIDGRSDIFSLGVTLYELLSHKRPFEGKTSTQVMEHIRKNKRTAIQLRRPDLPEGLCDIVEKATAHDPAARYQSAGEFAEELRNTLKALERSGQADTRSMQRSGVKQNRRPLISAGIALLIALASIGFWRIVWDRTPPIDVSNPKVAIATAKDKLSAGQQADALALFEALQKSGYAGHDLEINAYVEFLKKETAVKGADRTLELAEALGKKIRKNKDALATYDGWTSRPRTLFLLESKFDPGTFVENQALDLIIDAALNSAFVQAQAQELDYVDRNNIDALIEQQQLSYDLSEKSGGIQLGNFMGARFMVAPYFSKLTKNSKEKLVLEITDIETSKYVSAPPSEVPADVSPDALLLSVPEKVSKAIQEYVPLKARLYEENSQAVINIDDTIGVKAGMRFDVRRGKDDFPEKDIYALVEQAGDSSKSIVSLEGIAMDALPDTVEAGFYVQLVDDAS